MSIARGLSHRRQGTSVWTIVFGCVAVLLLLAPLVVRGANDPDAASSGRPGTGAGTVDADAPAAHDAPTPTSTLDNELIGSRPSDSAHSSAASSSTPSTQSPSFEVSRVIVALVLVIGLVFGLRWVGQRFLPASAVGRSSSAVQVITRAGVGAKQQVLLLRVGRRVLVVADNGAQLSALGEITDSDEIAALVGQVRMDAAVVPKPFGTFFRRYSRQFDSSEDEATQTPVGSDATDDSIETPNEAEARSVRAELSGLMQRVRVVARDFGSRSST